jgi:hypothetical protein
LAISALSLRPVRDQQHVGRGRVVDRVLAALELRLSFRREHQLVMRRLGLAAFVSLAHVFVGDVHVASSWWSFRYAEIGFVLMVTGAMPVSRDRAV